MSFSVASLIHQRRNFVSKSGSVQSQKWVLTTDTTLKCGSDCIISTKIFLKVVVTVTTIFKSGSDWTLPSLHKTAPMPFIHRKASQSSHIVNKTGLLLIIIYLIEFKQDNDKLNFLIFCVSFIFFYPVY